MQKISNILGQQSKLRRFQKPLEAARICEIAQSQARGRYRVLAFKNGLLTLACESPTAAGSLQTQADVIIEEINEKIGEEKVKRVRFRIQ